MVRNGPVNYMLLSRVALSFGKLTKRLNCDINWQGNVSFWARSCNWNCNRRGIYLTRPFTTTVLRPCKLVMKNPNPIFLDLWDKNAFELFQIFYGTPRFPSSAWQMLYDACQILDNCLSSIPSSICQAAQSICQAAQSICQVCACAKHLSSKHLWSICKATTKHLSSKYQAASSICTCLTNAWSLLGTC